MPAGFHHEACFYDGRDGFVAAVEPFVRAGLEAGEAVLVMVDAVNIRWLRDALGTDADRVTFADMGDVGRNPARIIPAWARFLKDARADARQPRGVGEPIVPARSASELRECHLHESLLNTVFIDDSWELLCPYDTSRLDPVVLEEARRTHPFVDAAASPSFAGEYAVAELAEPGEVLVDAEFDAARLRDVRHLARLTAEAAHLDGRVADIVLAVNEVLTNTVQHGGGHGRFRAWRDGASLVFEIRDTGEINDALVGRIEPPKKQVGGRGMWLCNQLCDLVQIQTSAAGTTVRLHAQCRVR